MNYNVTSLIKSELANLSESRGLFHSEADFQHELALCLMKNELVRGVRLERPFYANTKRIELDIFVLMSNLKIGIELKYKTRKLITTFNNEIYHIKNQAALGQMRYDYIKDIRRLEALKGINEIDVGYALLLTNILALWKNGNSPRYKDLYLYPSRVVRGDIGYHGGYVGKREAIIKLTGAYTLEWENFSQIENQEFKYLLVEI